MLMSKILQIYHAIGFRCKKEQNHLAQVGKNPETPFVKGTTMLADSLAYLDSLISLRKDCQLLAQTELSNMLAFKFALKL